jgi:hypothetical protein
MGALHRRTRRKFIVVIPARLLVIRPATCGTGGVYAAGRSGVNPDGRRCRLATDDVDDVAAIIPAGNLLADDGIRAGRPRLASACVG